MLGWRSHQLHPWPSNGHSSANLNCYGFTSHEYELPAALMNFDCHNVISEIFLEVVDHHEQNKNGEEDVQNLDKLILHDLIGNEEDGGNACVSDNQK